MCEPDWQYLVTDAKLRDFFRKNYDIIKEIPLGSCKTFYYNGKQVELDFKDATLDIYGGLKISDDHGNSFDFSDANTTTGTAVASIMNYFKVNFPEKYLNFMKTINPKAVRYIGNDLINPSVIEILDENDGTWKKIDSNEYFNNQKIVYLDTQNEKFGGIYDDEVVL